MDARHRAPEHNGISVGQKMIFIFFKAWMIVSSKLLPCQYIVYTIYFCTCTTAYEGGLPNLESFCSTAIFAKPCKENSTTVKEKHVTVIHAGPRNVNLSQTQKHIPLSQLIPLPSIVTWCANIMRVYTTRDLIGTVVFHLFEARNRFAVDLY